MKELKKNNSEMKQSKNVFVFADKTNNIYEVPASRYQKLLNDNITTAYKKTDNAVVRKVDLEAKVIAKSFNVANRVECYAKITPSSHSRTTRKIFPIH